MKAGCLGPALLRPDHVGALLASVLEHETVEVFGIFGQNAYVSLRSLGKGGFIPRPDSRVA